MKKLLIIALMLVGFSIQAQTVEQNKIGLQEQTVEQNRNRLIEIYNRTPSDSVYISAQFVGDIMILHSYYTKLYLLDNKKAEEIFDGVVKTMGKEQVKYLRKDLKIKYLDIRLYDKDSIFLGQYKGKFK